MTRETKELVEWAKAYIPRIKVNEFRLNQSIYICDLRKCLDSHIGSLVHNDGNPTFSVEIKQHRELKEKIEEMEKEGLL